MKGIVRNSSAEIEIKHSRFLAETFAVSSQEEARALLKEQKTRHADSTHVVHAFVIGPTRGILGCSDDGEPSNTAGRPVLDVLKGSSLTNALLTVTRWFGGTELGTGGLVKAYGDAAKAVLSVTPVSEIAIVREFELSVSYELYERVKREMVSRGVKILNEEFGTAIRIQGLIGENDAADFCVRISDLSSGNSRVAISEESRMGQKA